jgi:hypothetical protein
MKEILVVYLPRGKKERQVRTAEKLFFSFLIAVSRELKLAILETPMNLW